ncbi:basic 7S globulin-like [Dorcoceras hygrometricum]|uniref:Basic 7S globulin-like n=1 Tax=Dorcoceras hygrometricum TaxID=472368 RepID=A0A2Z7BCF2_9LAMI|nr:basic 7S globulin-like [Dorcoceras hygrometricum]
MDSIPLKILILVMFFSSGLTTTSRSHRRAPFKPKSLVLPLTKDSATKLHVAYIRKRSLRVSIPLIVDLNGRFLLLECSRNYLSSSYNAPICHSTQCSKAGVHYCHICSSKDLEPGCHNNTCAVIATNPVTQVNGLGELAQDVISIQSIAPDGSRVGPYAHIPDFLFTCAPSSLLRGPLPRGAAGVAGLSQNQVSLPVQVASYFGFQPEFALCLSPYPDRKGGIFFGNIPSSVRPKSLVYTQLTISEPGEYFIPVRSIRVNNKLITFKSTIGRVAFGGALISTTTPYTSLEHSIFESCASNATNTIGGIPDVDFVMQNRNVTWKVLGVDAILRARPGVDCLAFVDAGLNPRASIVIGTNQMEGSNFLHFDLARSRLGFVHSRLETPVNCTDFKYDGAQMDVLGDDQGLT